VPLPRYIAIANPDSKRWQTYARDLAGFWAARGVAPEIVVVPWRDVVPRDGNLDDLPAFNAPAIVRLESPGRDFEVTKLLLAAGVRDSPHEPATDWSRLVYRKGELVRPGLAYRGFGRVLRGLRAALDARPHLRPTTCPLAVAELFDKRATAARLARAGLPCPLPGPPADDAQTLLANLRSEKWHTAYVKLNTGSSASGIAVVHALDAPPWAVTSLIQIDGDYFNTRRLQHVRGPQLDAALAFLLREDAVVQQGIPMAQIDGQNFDVRVVMIYGRPAFTVFRLSSQPMTNLHLGGRRGEPAVCRAAIPTRAWLDALDHCTEAARLYPQCAAVGVDLIFERGYLRHYLLEINAFGDFFPGLRDERGRSVHEVEIEETVARMELATA
jgi:YheC/D like ATP-grasp